jgi:TPR repeat protein
LANFWLATLGSPETMTDAQYQTALTLYGQGRHAEGAQLLGVAAQAGHVPAMTLLGRQFLSGRGAPLDPIAGMRLIVAAAERDGGLACATTASLLAAGAAGRPEWHRALDYLRRSAELGFPMAQDQLRLLAGRDGGDWRVLRREIDVKAWRRAPRPQVLSRAPRVQAFEGVASPDICDWIIARARDGLRPAKVYDAGGGHTTSAGRSNSAVELSLSDADLVILAVRERLAACAGLQVMHMDGPQVLHYAMGQQFAQHVDFFDEAIPNQAQQLAANGQRVATALLYLNDEGLEGGETDFPRLGFKHRGKKGDALVFFNVDAAGKPDRQTLHAGLAPTRGEKWVVSQWFRDRPPPGVGDPRLVAALSGR